MPDDHDTFVLRARPTRVILFSAVLVFCVAMFLFMAGVAVMISVDSAGARIVLTLVALALLALACYLLLLLRTNINRIEVGPRRLKLRMVRVRGPLPLLGTIRADVPYGDIASVETREEIYSSFGLVTVLRAFSLVIREGTRLPLGVMAENWGSQLPYDEAAARIAARANVPVTDRGAVRVGGVIRTMIHDVPPWGTETMTPQESAASHRRAALTMQIVMGMVFATVALRACVRH